MWLPIVLLACSGKDDSGGSSTDSSPDESSFQGSCDTRGDNGQCRDWEGQSGADLSVSCDGMGGTFSSTQSCPTAGLAGSCTLDAVLGLVAIYRYYTPDYDETTAADHCASLGGSHSSG